MSTNIEFLHADQIGGCVTLISIDTTKICIDFGENLPGSKHKEALEDEGLTSGEQQYDAVFFYMLWHFCPACYRIIFS